MSKNKERLLRAISTWRARVADMEDAVQHPENRRGGVESLEMFKDCLARYRESLAKAELRLVAKEAWQAQQKVMRPLTQLREEMFDLLKAVRDGKVDPKEARKLVKQANAKLRKKRS